MALLGETRDGRSQAMVLSGEAGIGKTALLHYLLENADGCRVSRTAGVESEMELAFASLEQFCVPILDGMDRLPEPQRAALDTTFGLASGAPPDRFVVGLGVLNLLSYAAEQQPLLCVIDDAQWLDQASAQTLEFVARRLRAEPVAMVFALRTTDDQPTLTALPQLPLQGLSNQDAADLLDSVLAARLDGQVRDRLLAESHGNPLALLELPRELTSASSTFGVHDSAAPSLVDRLQDGFLRKVDGLSARARQLLVLAAADPVGDVDLVHRAGRRLGISDEDVSAAESTGMIELRHRVEFRHPLVRSAVYRSAVAEDRRIAHQALADVTDADEDPDRHAWHRSRAASGPDEAVADALEQSADRALSRGGLAAAAGFLETAATLTPKPDHRARRSLAAAQAKASAGAFDDALSLLAQAQAGPLGELDSARVDLLQAQISHHSEGGNKGLPLLLAAAGRLEQLDPKLARETYLDAFAAAMFAGRLASGSGIGMRQVAEAMRGIQLPPVAGKSDVMLRGIAELFTDGYAAAAPGLLDIVRAFGSDELTLDESVRFAWLAACAATDLFDDANWDVLTHRHLTAIREIGALAVLPVALTSRIIYDLYSGDLSEAEALVAECAWVAEVTGGQNTMMPYGEVCLSAIRGDVERAEPNFHKLLEDVTARGEGVGLNMIGWFQSVMFSGLGRHAEALTAARMAADSPLELGPPKWALAEVVEAGVHSDNTAEAARAFEQLSSFTQASGTDMALGVEAGRRALLQSGRSAEDCYREEADRLARTTLQVERTRAQLRYGEFLRREDRRGEARTQLRLAFETFGALGLDGFAERARQELIATGETVRRRTTESSADLTAQETRIAQLAVEGLTNSEIGDTMFLSARTVEWHLRKVYAKLGVDSRRRLRDSLSESGKSAVKMS
ncbi:DNA-binding CsgD family transcriptional regulator [Kribbella shirazensis]|uniref:DNA-binding CsgD family transcriptional regulator n=2 Tax=Kribbella shirazensis TaxID=1105143 RepID=A0A7X5VHM5_9ACTN|nr:DNA-binding CsgD family transcriptional regulator [Kribbella shirazensis]